MHNADMKLSPGNNQKIKAAETAHPNAIVGMTMAERLFQWSARYACGNSTPIAKRPVDRVTLIISSVNLFESAIQSRGFMTFVQWGPMIIPNAVARMASPM
jgi:hypothetical protein